MQWCDPSLCCVENAVVQKPWRILLPLLCGELTGAFHSTQNSGHFVWYIKWNEPFRFGDLVRPEYSGPALKVSTLTRPVISVGRTEMSLSIWQNCCSQYLFFVSFLQELSNAPWLGSGLCNWNVPFHWTRKTFDTECKYGGPLGRSGSSCAKARLVRPQEFCFDCAS